MMYTFKEKVTDRFTRFFADSSHSSSSSPSPPPQARPYSEGEKTFSSYFSYINPSAGFDRSISKKHQHDLKSIQEHPALYRTAKSVALDESLEDYVKSSPVCDKKVTTITQDGNEDPGSGRSTSGSEVFEEATNRHSPQKTFPQGAVFGGLLDCPLKPTAKRKYQGTNQTFVFTTIYGEPRLFRPTGANRYYHLCMDDLLAFGGGGNFALCLDGDLLSGTSGPCQTFGNLCLAHNEEFELKNVELWGFAHASRYLT